MARAKLSKALKNSYVQTVIIVLISLGIIFSFFFGVRLALRTEYPLLAVASGSMIPTLQVGDLIVVHGVMDPSEITAAPNPNGTMIVFHRPGYPRGGGFLFYAGDELIVHRVIARVEDGGTWYFQTKGDNNNSPDWWGNTPPDTFNGMVSSKLLVGRVVGVVPWVGNIPLFVRTPLGFALFIFLFLLILLIEYVPVLMKKQGQDQKPPTTPTQNKNLSVWRAHRNH